MSDITAEEYRTAAKVLQSAEFTGFCGRFPGEASWCQSEADRLEAESARDEYVETLANLYWEQYVAEDAERGRYRFGRLCEDAQRVVKAGIRAVLDQLAADGRLLAEGGTLAEAWDRGWNDCNHWWHDGEVAGEEPNNPYLDTPPAEPVPDSGPDGTPEKPWKRLGDIPDGVDEVVDCGSIRWRRIGSSWTFREDGKSPLFHGDDRAPFVRVDGDKA
ncbi:hypothetical protein GS676_02700 [Rhodococcus hoagii]|nr:hypothetical protein [Prescottella equi]